jgi:RimJ/RimL family protein N-acetyltransferase
VTASDEPTEPLPPIESARLRFRSYRPEDADALHASLADPAFMHWWSRPPLESIEATRAYLGKPMDPAWRAWFYTLKDDDTALGWVAAGEKRQGGVTEIGYVLAREHHGHGYAREAVGAVIEHLFAVENKRRVFADTDPENLRSRKLLESLGFQLEGILRHEWETHIGVRDTALYGLIKEEWIWPRPI